MTWEIRTRFMCIRREPRSFRSSVQVPDVLVGEAASKLYDRLQDELDSPELAQRLFYWIKPKLTSDAPTLKLDQAATEKRRTTRHDQGAPSNTSIIRRATR